MPSRKKFKSNEEYNAWYREYREKNREKMRLYNKDYNQTYRLIHGYDNEIKWIAKNSEKISSQKKLRYAIKTGKIKRLKCEICKGISQAHHNDYDKPLNVIWLCAKHHKRLHLIFPMEKLKNKRKKSIIKLLKELDYIRI